MKNLRSLFAWMIIIGSVALGIYVGIYVMLYGGMVELFDGLKELEGKGIAGGICRIVFCEVAMLIPIVGVLMGGMIFGKKGKGVEKENGE